MHQMWQKEAFRRRHFDNFNIMTFDDVAYGKQISPNR